MSAFIVSRKHIACLVDAIAEYDVIDFPITLAELGQILWNENIMSVKHRYPGESLYTLPGPVGEYFVYDAHEKACWERYSPLEQYKLARSYVYQSCEHPGWEGSLSCQYVTTLMEALEKEVELITGMPIDRFMRTHQYRELAWEA